MKNAIINARMEIDLKKEVEVILNDLGLTATQAITIFYKQIKLHHGIPFELKIPNKETIKALEDAHNGVDMEIVSLDELKEQLTQ